MERVVAELRGESDTWFGRTVVSTGKLVGSYLLAQHILSGSPSSASFAAAAITPLGFPFDNKKKPNASKLIGSGLCAVVAGVQIAALVRSASHLRQNWSSMPQWSAWGGAALVGYSAVDLMSTKLVGGLDGFYNSGQNKQIGKGLGPLWRGYANTGRTGVTWYPTAILQLGLATLGTYRLGQRFGFAKMGLLSSAAGVLQRWLLRKFKNHPPVNGELSTAAPPAFGLGAVCLGSPLLFGLSLRDTWLLRDKLTPIAFNSQMIGYGIGAVLPLVIDKYTRTKSAARR
jgi:hypothetical protein